MELYFSTDVLLDILQRPPPSSRRRARLVCRHWRDVVDDRTTEMQSRTKPLIWDTCSVEAHVVDFSTPWKATCKRMADSDNYFRAGVQLVGTCNGLLCLYSNNKPGGIIMVVNPSTRQKLRVSPLRGAGLFVGSRRRPVGWDQAYSFGYHPITGRYKVVHVPCSFDRVCEFDAVHVLTLGEAAWREVPLVIPGAGGAKCNLNAGVVSINGATHWFTGGDSARIMCFDLQDERVISTPLLPALPAGRDRLGVAIWDGSVKTEVWVLNEERWSRWYTLRRDIPQPHFAYGEYVLTRISLSFDVHREKGRWLSGERAMSQVSKGSRGWSVAEMIGDKHCYRTFAYVETAEPLDVFRRKQLGVNTTD
ncbi:hypothetical protein ACQ4PT_029559 [Festuca glaucescens]